MKYGPNTRAVKRLIKQARKMTFEQATQIEACSNSDRDVQQNMLWIQAWTAARDAYRWADRYTAWSQIDRFIRKPAQDAAWSAVSALVVRDKISDEHFDVLYGPWATVFGEPK